MRKGKIVLNSTGIREMLKSDGVIAALTAEASTAADRAGNSEVEVGFYPERGRAVYVKQNATSKDMEENTLLKGVQSK